jgi:hypothetical protein
VVTREYRYQNSGFGFLVYLVLAAALLVATFVFSRSDPAFLAIATGLGFLGVVRVAIQERTHRLSLESDAVVTTSSFGRRRLPYASIRAIRYWIVDRETDRVAVTLTTMERDLTLGHEYAELVEIADEIRQRAPQAIVHDERRYGPSLPGRP